MLEKAFMFVPKPATYISYEQTQSVTFSRVAGAVSTLSTFDITVELKNGAGSSQFSNINREDLKALEDFFKLKGLRVKNEIDEDAKLVALALRDANVDDESDDEDGGAGGASKADRGSADEDEESVDEDFQAESESEVAEEFDSNHESDSGSGSGSGSDGESEVDEDEDEMDVDEEEEEEEEKVKPPPKKKAKTSWK